MNSAKTILVILFLFCKFLNAEEIPFSVSGTPPPSAQGVASLEDPDLQARMISELKTRAVNEWLSAYLGNRYPQFEKNITPDFSERYISDYKVNRTGADRNTMQLIGHIDSDSLKRWVRLQETKKGTTSIKPVLCVSSAIPGLGFSASESSEKTRTSPIGETVFNLANHQFQRVNAHIGTAEKSFPISKPPKEGPEFYALRDWGIQSGYNSVLWVDLSPCATCGGAKVDVFLYSLPSSRLVFALNDDLALQTRDYSSAEKLKTVLTPVFQNFHSEFESAISEGKLFSNEYRILVEGIDSYRLYKTIEVEMTKLDFLSQAVLRHAESKTAEFRVVSSLSSEELAQRVQTNDFGGFHLKPVRVDSKTISVRYSKQ